MINKRYAYQRSIFFLLSFFCCCSIFVIAQVKPMHHFFSQVPFNFFASTISGRYFPYDNHFFCISQFELSINCPGNIITLNLFVQKKSKSILHGTCVKQIKLKLGHLALVSLNVVDIF